MELNNGSKIEVHVEAVSTTVIEPAVIPAPTLEVRTALREEPSATPVMYQTWSDLLFLHWEWDPAEIQATLPPGLFVDTFGVKAYVAVTPFVMNEVRASFLPPIPGASNFFELNVRTYVHDRNGVPGIWFYSLDCSLGLAAMLAKAFYSLPYYTAEMSATSEGGYFRYHCRRQGEREQATFHYRKEEQTVGSQPGSLPFFLAERYLLYSFSTKTQKLYRARVHHAPWQLFKAQLGKYDETMLRVNNLDPKLRAPSHSWLGAPVRVKVYALEEA
jgi:uncharacterized protein